MSTWEYRIYILDDSPNARGEEEKRITALGHQGWEMVTVCFRTGWAPYIFFKRPIIEEDYEQVGSLANARVT